MTCASSRDSSVIAPSSRMAIHSAALAELGSAEFASVGSALVAGDEGDEGDAGDDGDDGDVGDDGDDGGDGDEGDDRDDGDVGDVGVRSTREVVVGLQAVRPASSNAASAVVLRRM